MKIQYKKKHVIFNLILGILWTMYTLVLFFESEKLGWSFYIWPVISGTYLFIALYKMKYKYITLENGTIAENWIFGKKLLLYDIKKIRYFAGDLTLTTETKTLTINTQLIEKEDVLRLKSELKKLTAEWS